MPLAETEIRRKLQEIEELLISKRRARLDPLRTGLRRTKRRLRGYRSKSKDPQEHVKPIDFHGYDGLNMVRLAPEIDQLIEVQVVLPQHQFDRLLDTLEESGYDDVEVSDNNKLIVRRGSANAATNIFIERER